MSSSPPAHGSGSEDGQEEEHDQDALDRALWAASGDGNLAEVLAQLEAGADVHGGGLDGPYRPPLHLASVNGNLGCVRALLAAGADVEQSVGGCTALSFAALYGHTHVVRCLLEAGASQDVGDAVYNSGVFGALGFSLQVLQLLRAYAPARSVVLGPYLRAVPGLQAFLDATRRWTSQLHYFQFLPVERVAGLLADGADVHASDGSTDAPTPIGLARTLLCTGSTDPCAELIVSTDPIPWSECTYELFPPRGRARAVELLLAGHLLARSCPGSGAGQGTALLDVWVAHVMPCALHR
jgi:hypothetical protein